MEELVDKRDIVIDNDHRLLPYHLFGTHYAYNSGKYKLYIYHTNIISVALTIVPRPNIHKSSTNPLGHMVFSAHL